MTLTGELSLKKNWQPPEEEGQWIILWNKIFHNSIAIADSCYAVK
jgi:hypothetical protein